MEEKKPATNDAEPEYKSVLPEGVSQKEMNKANEKYWEQWGGEQKENK